jgi:hypothetical protein
MDLNELAIRPVGIAAPIERPHASFWTRLSEGHNIQNEDDPPSIKSGIPMQTRPTLRLLFVTLTLACVLGCSRNFDQVSPRPSTRGAITRVDLDHAVYATAYHAIESIRPNWLWSHRNATIANPNPFPIVYVDLFRRGGLDELHLISADDIETMKLLSPADATTQWGTGHLAGAIDVRTRRGQGPARRPGE